MLAKKLLILTLLWLCVGFGGDDFTLYNGDDMPLGGGVYLGDGFFLTTYQAVSGEDFFRRADGIVPLFAQLWDYDADGVADMGEEIWDDYICPSDAGFQMVDQATEDCFPYNQASEAFIRNGADPQIYPVAEVVYLNRANQIALLKLAENPPDETITTWDETLPDMWAGRPIESILRHLARANLNLKSEALAQEGVLPLDTLDPFTPEIGSSGYEVVHYDLHLKIDPTIPYLEGIASLELQITHPHLREITLDLLNLQVNSVANFEFEQSGGKLHIDLGETQATTLHLDIDYSGELAPIDSPYFPYGEIGALIDPVSPRVAMVTQPDAARTWFPTNDHPADAATYDFYFTVEPPFEAVGNGILEDISENPDGTRTFHWRMDDPMASYLAVLAVADYERIEEFAPNGIPLSYWVYASSNLAVMQRAFGSTPAAMSLLETYFGEYPFETYGQVIVPMSGGALETQTMSAMPYVLRDADSEADFFFLIVHELAHQWFGNAVRLENWQDIWLNEGLATLAEWITIDDYTASNTAQRWRNQAENRILRSDRQTALAYPLPAEMFHNDTYEKGAWVFFMLKNELGAEVFFPLLQAYAQTFRGESTSTLAFFQFAERFSGRDLTDFRVQWVQQSGIPRYDLWWQVENKTLTLRFCATRLDQAYNIDIPLVLTDGAKTQSMTIPVQTDEAIWLELDFQPTDLKIDPDEMVLEAIQARQGAKNTC